MYSVNCKVQRDLATPDKTITCWHVKLMPRCYLVLVSRNTSNLDTLDICVSEGALWSLRASGKFPGIQRFGKYWDFPSKVRDRLQHLHHTHTISFLYGIKKEEQCMGCLFRICSRPLEFEACHPLPTNILAFRKAASGLLQNLDKEWMPDYVIDNNDYRTQMFIMNWELYNSQNHKIGSA